MGLTTEELESRIAELQKAGLWLAARAMQRELSAAANLLPAPDGEDRSGTSSPHTHGADGDATNAPRCRFSSAAASTSAEERYCRRTAAALFGTSRSDSR